MSRGSWQFVVILFSISSLLEISAWGHMEAFTPLFIARELGIRAEDVPFWTGVLAAAPLIVAAPLSPFWGVLADRFNRKLFIMRVLAAGMVGYALAAISQDVWQYLGTRLLLGLTFGGNALIVGTIASLVPHARVGIAIGMFQMVLPIGKSVGPLFGSMLINTVGLRGMFAVDALLVLVAFLLVLFLFKEPPRERDVSLGVLARLGAVLRLVWREPPIRLTFILSSLFAGGMWMINPFIPILIQRVYRGEDVATVIGLILAGYGALAALSSPLAGRLSDYFGPTTMVVFNMGAMLAMSVGLAFASTPLQVALIVLLGAIPFGASNTTIYTYLAHHTPREHLGGVMSLTPMARNSAMLLGPLLGAAVSTLGLSAVFATGALVYLLALGVSLKLKALARPE